MTASAENKRSGIFNYTFLVLAIAVVVAGVWGYYYFVEQSNLYAVLTVLAAIAVALGLTALTSPGKLALDYVRASRTEIKKVVWPTRQESLQTLLMVAVLTGILSLFLLLCDLVAGKGFEWLMP